MTWGRSLSATSSSLGRFLDGPDQSKVHKLFEPTPVKIKDVETKYGRTRVFWVRDQIKPADKLPLVLLHGWGAGSGCFFKNIHEMAADRPILLIDLPGFGESERIEFSEEPESDWLAALKAVINLELSDGQEFWLGGHSFGAYLAGLLALERGNDLDMKGVILMDAWGYAIMTESFEEKLAKLPWYARGLYHMFKGKSLGVVYSVVPGNSGSKMTGLDLMRKFPENMARPMLKKARKDLTNIYGEYFIDYTYDINSQQPATGEIAFASLGKGFGFAARPMEERFLARLNELPDNVHFIYGGKSWVSSHSGKVIEGALKETNKKCSVTVIEGATHHLMCTNPNEFNEAVNNILNSPEKSS